MIANRVTEKDVRNWLNKHGFYGRTAVFYELELYAIKRPGWLQVFRFHIRVKSEESDWTELYGAVRDDEREKNLEKRTQVAVFENTELQQDKLDEWSEELIVQGRRGDSGSLGWTLIIGAIFLLALLVLRLMKQ